MSMRFASPNERRTISREDLGFYNAFVIAAVYEVARDKIDVNSVKSFIPPLKRCILEHPYLGVVVKNKHTETPAFEGVSSIDLNNHISITHNDKIRGDTETETLEKALLPILDRPWPVDIPPWRIVVLPLASENDPTVTRCCIAFSFSHTIGDGMSGLTFHRTFLNTWQQPSSADENPSVLITPPNQTLPPPFDTPERLPISWTFLLSPLIAAYLPKFLNDLFALQATASPVDAGTWTGAPMFYDPSSPNSSRLRILEIEAPLVQKALRVSRAHGTKLTGTMHQMIIRALGKAIPEGNGNVTNFVSGTAIDMRGSIGVPAYTWGLYVSGHYDVHLRPPRHVSEESGRESSTLSDEMWASASSMTKRLAECATRLQDQAIGLLRYVPSMRNWTAGKVGERRDCSYRVSNLLSFDGGMGGQCKISKVVFATPADVTGAALDFDVVSVKGGSLVCSVSWQAGALGLLPEEEGRVVDEICSSIRGDFECLEG